MADVFRGDLQSLGGAGDGSQKKRLFTPRVSGQPGFVLGGFQGRRGGPLDPQRPSRTADLWPGWSAKPTESSGGSEPPSGPTAQTHNTYCFILVAH